MKAVVLSEILKPILYQEMEQPSDLAADEVLIKITAAAINHRDIYITQGQYAGIETPAVLGSDAVGVVVAVGKAVEKSQDAQLWQAAKVVINPNINWGERAETQAKNYQVLGMPTQGTMAEFIKLPLHRLHLCPQHLTDEQAAALPLAGLTAFRALFSRAEARTGDRVLISGIGGGVALFAMQFALAAGLEVWVTSSSDEKIAKAVAMGAKGGANYKQADWHKSLQKQAGGGFDVVIDSAGGDGFGLFVDIANPAARIAFYGGTHGKFSLNPQKMFWKQISVLGSTMGSDEEFAQMLAFVAQHKIIPAVDSVFSMADAQKAFDYMRNSQQFGKIVLIP